MSNRRLAIVNPLITESMAHLDKDVTLECAIKSSTLDQRHSVHEKNGQPSHIEPGELFPFETYVSQAASTQSPKTGQAWSQQPRWYPSSNVQRLPEFQQNSAMTDNLLKPALQKENAPIPSASVVPFMRTGPGEQIPLFESTGSRLQYHPAQAQSVFRLSYGPNGRDYRTMVPDASEKGYAEGGFHISPVTQLSDHHVPVPCAWRPRSQEQTDVLRLNPSNSSERLFLNRTDHQQLNHTRTQRKDLAVQTDVEKNPNDESGDESGGSDSFESESPKPSPSHSALQTVPGAVRTSPDSTQELRPLNHPLMWNTNNPPRRVEHEGYGHETEMVDEKVALCVRSELREHGRRNSVTSLDSGRDSTYAPSSESSSGGGNPNNWSQSVKAEADKAPRLVRSPSHTVGGCQQQQQQQAHPVTSQFEKKPIPVSSLNMTACGTSTFVHNNELSGTVSRVPCPLVQDVECERYSCAFRDPTTSWQQPRTGGLAQRSVCNVASWQSVDEGKQLAHWLHTAGLSRLERPLSDAGFCLWTLCRATPEELNVCGITSPIDRQILRAALSRLHLPDPLPNCLPDTVQDWLCQLNLDHYWPNLLDQGLTTFTQLAQLTWEELDEIGIKKLGHQKKFLLGIAKLEATLGWPNPMGNNVLSGMRQSKACPGLATSPTYDVIGKSNSSRAILKNEISPYSSAFINFAVDRGRVRSDSVDDDDFPIPEPPPGFQDNHIEELLKPKVIAPTMSLRPTAEQIGTVLQTHTSTRRSSFICTENGDTRNDSISVQLPYSVHAERRSFSVSLGSDLLGSEPDLYSRMLRSSTSPPNPHSRNGSSTAQLTKWSSGQLNAPVLRLPNTYQNVIHDPELKDMNDLREMLDALSENLTASAQI